MPRDEELTFADHMGRYYARRFGFPPMVGRVLGYLLVCTPRSQSIAELSEALLASRSAVTQALAVLETQNNIRRTRAAGERMDRVSLDFASSAARGFDVTEYEELGALAREGLEVVADAPPEHRAALTEMVAFADWLAEATRKLEQDWTKHRAKLRKSGELPA